MKKLLFIPIILALIIVGCVDGGDECPPMDTTIYYNLEDGSLGMDVIKKGEISGGEINRVMSKAECDELLEDYRGE